MRPELSRKSWRRVRVEVRQRDRNTCQACGAVQSPFARRAFPVGHRVPPGRYQGGHDDPANLLTLCFACNASQGGQDFDAWLRQPYGRPAQIRAGKVEAFRGPPRLMGLGNGYTRRCTIFHKESAGG